MHVSGNQGILLTPFYVTTCHHTNLYHQIYHPHIVAMLISSAW